MRHSRDISRSKAFRDFWPKSCAVHKENCEYEFDDKGQIVKGKAPNLKRIREFYKKQARFNRLRKRK